MSFFILFCQDVVETLVDYDTLKGRALNFGKREVRLDKNWPVSKENVEYMIDSHMMCQQEMGMQCLSTREYKALYQHLLHPANQHTL